jgi:HEPN domain-containing protein
VAKIFTARSDGLVPCDLLHSGLDQMTAAKALFDTDPSHYDSAGYLAHLGVELIVKSWLLELEGEFEGIHNLQSLFQRLVDKHGVEALSAEHQATLKLLDQFDHLRYPNRNEPVEIGDDDYPRIEALVGHLCRSMPQSIPDSMEKLEYGHKGGRVLMKKKRE